MAMHLAMPFFRGALPIAAVYSPGEQAAEPDETGINIQKAR